MPEMGITFVPQGRRVFPRLTVLENLELGGFMIKDKKELKRRIGEVVQMFPGLESKNEEQSRHPLRWPATNAGTGKRTCFRAKSFTARRAVARAFPKIVKEVFAKIKEINERHKIAIMVVEHNIKIPAQYRSSGLFIGQRQNYF